MNSILNSISSGDLLVQQVPRETPIKQDSISAILQDSDIEFEILPKQEEVKESSISDIEIEFDNICDNSEQLKQDINLESLEQVTDKENSIEDLLINGEITLNICPHPKHDDIDFNTGFGENLDLHYELPCKKPDLKVPLYKDNYLREFVSEEEKSAARHSLGLYNKHDIVAMSLLTAEDVIPDSLDFVEVTFKQLRKGDLFFAPITLLDAVFDNRGVKLSKHLEDIWEKINSNTQNIDIILNISEGNSVNSLGDVRLFLLGFTKKNNLYKVIDDINLEMLKFESTGTI